MLTSGHLTCRGIGKCWTCLFLPFRQPQIVPVTRLSVFTLYESLSIIVTRSQLKQGYWSATGFLVLLCLLLFIKTSMQYLAASVTLGYDLGRYFMAKKVTRKKSHVTLHIWKIGLANARFLGVYYAARAGIPLYAACKFQQNLCCIWSLLDVLRTCVTRLCVLGWLISFLLNSFLLCAQSISCSLSLTLSLSLCKRPQAPDGSCRGWGLLYLPLRGLPFVFCNLSLNPPIKTSYGSRLTNPSCLTICSPNPTNLSVEQLVVEENEVQPDSLDECYLAASVGHHLAGSCHPYRSASFPTERREVFLALDVNGEYSQAAS